VLDNRGAERVAAAADTGEARSMALSLMSQALDYLDSDSNIPSIIGAHLQSAIDMLWSSSSSK
jgi:hypothetical protein